jgi:hypothetical protein
VIGKQSPPRGRVALAIKRKSSPNQRSHLPALFQQLALHVLKRSVKRAGSFEF